MPSRRNFPPITTGKLRYQTITTQFSNRALPKRLPQEIRSPRGVDDVRSRRKQEETQQMTMTADESETKSESELTHTDTDAGVL